MASFTTIVVLPHTFHSSHSLSLSSNFLHYQFRFYSLPPRRSRFRVSHAIPKPKFDLNLRSSSSSDGDGDYSHGDSNGRGRRRTTTWKRRKSNNRRLKQRRWWNDDVEEEEDDDDDDVERGIFDQVVDSLWILQVFRSYGWFSPIILVSFLAATGPKAFFTAFSIPFGLSLLIFAYQKLQEWLASRPKPQNRRKRRSKFGRRNNAYMEEDVDQEGQQVKRNKKRENQSGAPQNNGSFYANLNGNGVHGNNFGGWDELVRDDETQHVHRAPPENGRPKIVEGGEEERLSRSMEDRDLPLLLRLLVAVFPFLASWTDLL